MAKRSYNQYCPLAYSLDVIGERWTLLIVRELMFGPRRYTDLLAGLPGIGTNLLAKRLKEMEAEKIIKQEKLPPPAASTVYMLGERGESLMPILSALADWGMAYVDAPADDESISVVQAMGAMYKLLPHDVSSNITVRCIFHHKDEVFHAVYNQGTLQVGFGAIDNPDVVAKVDLTTLLRVMRGTLSQGEAERSGGLEIQSGEGDSLGNFFTTYHG